MWFNNKGWTSSVGYMNAANNLVLRSKIKQSGRRNYKDFGITLINHPMNRTETQFIQVWRNVWNLLYSNSGRHIPLMQYTLYWSWFSNDPNVLRLFCAWVCMWSKKIVLVVTSPYLHVHKLRISSFTDCFTLLMRSSYIYVQIRLEFRTLIYPFHFSLRVKDIFLLHCW